MSKKKSEKVPNIAQALEVGKRERKREYTLSFSTNLYSDIRKTAYVR